MFIFFCSNGDTVSRDGSDMTVVFAVGCSWSCGVFPFDPICLFFTLKASYQLPQRNLKVLSTNPNSFCREEAALDVDSPHPCQPLSTEQPLNSLLDRDQMSIEDFLMHADSKSLDFQRLVNPSAREFGVTAADQLEPFFDSALSTFKLVSRCPLSIF